jgi:hypothetical protein
MERAGTIIARWKASGRGLESDEVAGAAWRLAAGDKVAAHTINTILIRKHLVVEVDDDLFRRQLLSLRPWMLRNIVKVLGEGVIEEIELRLAAPRKGAVREERAAALPPKKSVQRDEADGISDAVMRRIYRAARNRSPA